MVRIRPRASGSEGGDAYLPDPVPPAPSVLDPVVPPEDVYDLPEDIWAPEAFEAEAEPEPEPEPELLPPPPPPPDELDEPEEAAWEEEEPLPPTGLAPLLVPPRKDVSLAGAGLIMAVVILLTGMLSALTGLADEGDDVATSEVTTTTVGSTTTTVLSSTIPAGATSTTLGSVPTVILPDPPASGGDGTSVTLPPRRSSTGSGGGGGGGGNPTTTATTAPPTSDTTTPTATTEPPAGNQPLTIEMTTNPAAPKAGQSVDVIFDLRDNDAVPTLNCMEITGDDGVVLDDFGCDDPECDPLSGIPPQGATRRYSFNHTYSQAGRYTVRIRARSGDPECGNPYASRASETFTIDVAVAE